MTEDERYEMLNGWLDILQKEVIDLRVSQHIFWEVQEIIRANPRINIGSSFYEWMGSMYVAAMSVAVRRQVDEDKASVSFLRLLKEVKRYPKVLSRSRYKSRFTNPAPENYKNGSFDKLAGPGRDHVDPAVVEAEIADLRTKTDELRKYVNKRVAHYDKAHFGRFPTFQDLDDAIDYLEVLLKRYMNLFRAIHLGSALPVWQYDWKKVFRYPWIDPETSEGEPG